MSQETWKALNKISILKNDNGSALIYAIIILMVLTILGTSSTRTTIIELNISGNDKLHKIAFFACEAGIESGRAILNDLKKTNSGSWDDLLAATMTGATTPSPADDFPLNDILDSEGRRNVDSAVFSLAVRDNEDLDLNDKVDTDNTIVLMSNVDYKGAKVKIEARVHFLGRDEYVQEQYDSESSGKAADESAAPENNIRW